MSRAGAGLRLILRGFTLGPMDDDTLTRDVARLGGFDPAGMAALLDLHDKLRFGVLHGVDDPVTRFLDQGQQARDGFYSDHQGGAGRTNRCIRVLRRLPDEFILSPGIWSVLLIYDQVAASEERFDIETEYIYETRKGEIRRPRQRARYRLRPMLRVTHAPGAEAAMQDDLARIAARLQEVRAATASLRAWAASGWAMEVRCPQCWDGLRRAPSTTLTPARVQELAQQLPDLATLRSKLRCQRCGKQDSELRVLPA